METKTSGFFTDFFWYVFFGFTELYSFGTLLFSPKGGRGEGVRGGGGGASSPPGTDGRDRDGTDGRICLDIP